MKNFTKFFLSLALMLMALPNVLGGNTIIFLVDGIRYAYNTDDVASSVSVDGPGESYSGRSIVIPSQVMWKGVKYSVTSIDRSAFSGCTGLISIEIPNSVTSIGEGAFSGITMEDRPVQPLKAPSPIDVTLLGQ